VEEQRQKSVTGTPGAANYRPLERDRRQGGSAVKRHHSGPTGPALKFQRQCGEAVS